MIDITFLTRLNFRSFFIQKIITKFEIIFKYTEKSYGVFDLAPFISDLGYFSNFCRYGFLR